MPLLALTRAVSPALADCQLTHLSRVAIDVARAEAQHADYERALSRLGCLVRRLPSGRGMPDSVFIEDTAVILDEVAIVARSGAESRRRETTAVADALEALRPLVAIEPPGTLDGGDVLVVGRRIFVGRSGRTNADGCEQVRRAAEPFGYQVQAVGVRGCLHLKSAVTAIADRVLLVNPRWAPMGALTSFECIEVDFSERAAANVVRVGDRLLSSAAYPRTVARLEESGFSVTTVEVSELAKAEGALTCCSLLVSPARRPRPGARSLP